MHLELQYLQLGQSRLTPSLLSTSTLQELAQPKLLHFLQQSPVLQLYQQGKHWFEYSRFSKVDYTLISKLELDASQVFLLCAPSKEKQVFNELALLLPQLKMLQSAQKIQIFDQGRCSFALALQQADLLFQQGCQSIQVLAYHKDRRLAGIDGFVVDPHLDVQLERPEPPPLAMESLVVMKLRPSQQCMQNGSIQSDRQSFDYFFNLQWFTKTSLGVKAAPLDSKESAMDHKLYQLLSQYQYDAKVQQLPALAQVLLPSGLSAEDTQRYCLAIQGLGKTINESTQLTLPFVGYGDLSCCIGVLQCLFALASSQTPSLLLEIAPEQQISVLVIEN